MRKRRGISEIISVIIILLIVSIAGVILFNFSLQTTGASQMSLQDELDKETGASKERFTITSVVKINNNSIVISMLNYGKIDIIIDEIYVNGIRSNYYYNNLEGDEIIISDLEKIPLIDNNLNFVEGQNYNILVITERGVGNAYLWKIPVPGS